MPRTTNRRTKSRSKRELNLGIDLLFGRRVRRLGAVPENDADRASVLAKYKRVRLDDMRLWLAGKHVCPADAVLPGGAFLLSAAKTIENGP